MVKPPACWQTSFVGCIIVALVYPTQKRLQRTQVENLCKDRALKAFSLDEKVLLGLWKVVFGSENQGFPTHKISSLSEKKKNLAERCIDSTSRFHPQNRFVNTNRALEFDKTCKFGI